MNTKAHSASGQGIALSVLVLVMAVFGAVSCFGPTGIEIEVKTPVSAVLNLGGADIEGYRLLLEPGPDGTVARPKEDPVWPGYSFGGWYANEGCTVPYDFPRTVVTGTTVIYAKWDKIIRIVRFFSNYGAGVEVEYPPQEVLDGHYAVWPALPSRPGFGFTGWFTDAAGTALFAFEQPVTGDTTLYAQWSDTGSYYIYYSLNYSGGGVMHEEVPGNNTLTVNELWRPEPSLRPGYVFVDWYEGPGCMGSPWTGGTLYSDKTLYAKWTAPEHTVTFMGNGGLPELVTAMVPYAEKANPPSEAPFRGGYRFTGWYTEPVGGEPVDFDQPITSARMFYARWKPVYTVTLMRLSTGSVKSYLVDAGEDLTLPDKTELGWDGTGALTWYRDSEYTQPYTGGPAITPTGNTTLYGKFGFFGDIPKPTWTVTLVNLAQGVMKQYPVEQGESLTLPPGDLGWSGTGALTWYRDSGHTEQHSATRITPAVNTILYGRFAGDAPLPVTETYTVTLLHLAQGAMKQYEVEAGKTLFLPNAATLGWTGTGALTWYEYANYTGQYNATKITPVKDTTLYGRFAGDVPPPVKQSYTVTLVRLATGSVKTYLVEEGTDFTLPGKTALGWTDGIGELTWWRKSDHTDRYRASAIPVEGFVTLYGRFEGDMTYTVTVMRLATGSMKQYMVERGTTLPLPAAATLGWTGTGAFAWWRDANHTKPGGTKITPAGDTTLYGRFEGDIVKPVYTVTLVRMAAGAAKTYPVEQGTTFYLPAVTTLGWSGTGALTWYRDSNYKEQHSGSRITPAGDTTLYGRFEGDIPKPAYTVTLVNLAQGKTKQYVMEKGAVFTLPPGDLGWTGTGALSWYEDSGHTVPYSGEAKITLAGNVMLYGRYAGDIPKQSYTVTLVRLATGAVKSYPPVEKGTIVTLPSLSDLGWTGDGAFTWYQQLNPERAYSGSTILVTGYVTLYGEFAGDRAPAYTVTLLNLAQGKIKQYPVQQGTNLTLPPAGLGWSGTGALKWYRDFEHTDEVSASSISPAGDTTLYGRFAGDIAKPAYTVTLLNLAQGKMEQYVVEQGESLTLPNAAELGWSGTPPFTWYRDSAYTQQYSASSISPVENTTLYGKFVSETLPVEDYYYAITLELYQQNQWKTCLVLPGTAFTLPTAAELGWTGTGTFTWWEASGTSAPIHRILGTEILANNSRTIYGVFTAAYQ